MKNLGLKSFSMLIAIVLAWYVHSGSNSSVRTFVSSIEIRRVPQGKVVLSPHNPHVQVTVKGPAFVVSGIAEAPPVFKIVLPTVSSDRFSISLDQSALAIPSHVEVLNIDPPQIDFILDSIKEKPLTVTVPRVGALNENLKIEEVAVTPDRVTASGPESELNGVVSVETEPLDLREIKGDGEIELALKSSGSLTKLSISRVRVQVKTSQVLVQRHFEHIPIEVRSLPGLRFSVIPADISVTVSGLRREVERLARNSLLAYVRISEDTRGDFDADVGVEAPPGITVQSFEPKKTRVSAVGDRGTVKSPGVVTNRSREVRKK